MYYMRSCEEGLRKAAKRDMVGDIRAEIWNLYFTRKKPTYYPPHLQVRPVFWLSSSSHRQPIKVYYVWNHHIIRRFNPEDPTVAGNIFSLTIMWNLPEQLLKYLTKHFTIFRFIGVNHLPHFDMCLYIIVRNMHVCIHAHMHMHFSRPVIARTFETFILLLLSKCLSLVWFRVRARVLLAILYLALGLLSELAKRYGIDWLIHIIISLKKLHFAVSIFLLFKFLFHSLKL